MSLDVRLMVTEPHEIYGANITHNLVKMGSAAGLYYPLWRPHEIDCTKAKHVISLLRTGLEDLEADPERFKKMNPDNGWGTYDGLVAFTRNYLKACIDNPEADIEVSR